jgi:ATP-dependent Zn protease
MSLFNKIKTGNVFFDTIITTLSLTLMSYIVKVLYEMSFDNDFKIREINIKETLKYWFYKKNMITMSGKKCSSINYHCAPIVSSSFGERFKAVWFEIIKNIDKNPSISEIKDFLTLTQNNYYDNSEEENSNNNNNTSNNDVFIVSQKTPFVFNAELKIYALTKIFSEETKNDKNKGTTSKIENIEIILYSYDSSLAAMKKYIDDITIEYLDAIEKKRNNKQFIYTLIKTKFEESRFECWKESCFDTTRAFDNMFFEKKTEVLQKLDFFLQNKEWYYKKGIPYTIGFGLHGPPGTGKTSFVKSLAKYTKRHLIVLSLKLIKTRRQLQSFFYEDRYNENNKRSSLGFDNKIIVIEDIDAQGDIVLDRSKKIHSTPTIDFTKITEKTNVGEVIKTLIENEKEEDKKLLSSVLKPVDDEPITLDDILNLWDGIEETSGRILVISSNHYNELDPALRRPGRIDVSVEMNNASRKIIGEMYYHLYEREINKKALTKVKPYLYSPAEIINLYLMYKNDENGFMNRLTMNKKL